MGNLEAVIQTWRSATMSKFRKSMTRADRLGRLIEMLYSRMFTGTRAIKEWKVRTGIYEGMGKTRWLDKNWRSFTPGREWGGTDITAVFCTSIIIPREYNGQCVFLNVFPGGEGLLFVNDREYSGIDCFHTDILLAEKAKGGAKYDLRIEVCSKSQVDKGPRHSFQLSQIAVLDREIEEFYWDCKVALQSADNEWYPSELRDGIFTHLEKTLDLANPFEENLERFIAGIRKGSDYIRNTIYSEKSAPAGQLAAVGHSHLDVIFEWEFKEYVRKIGRTHATQLRLMEEFPEFKFSQSQAITYKLMKKHYPEIYRQVKQRAREKRWEILGAMFTEPDCNLISGESMVRQIMFGKRFFKKEFGVAPGIAWACDGFGFQYSLPQIFKKSGIDYFVTHKMAIWNDTNAWPYNLFWWKGLDGSKVLAHVPPMHFIGHCEADNLIKHWTLFKEKCQSNESMYCYGWGDGGGGVDRRMLQFAKRYKHFIGVPKLKMGFAESFFKRIEHKVNDRLPVWNNELYLETHRGTYTTSGILKKLNRKSEILYRDIEFLASIAKLANQNYKYPQDRINQGWEQILTGQFHDGVTGTHIEKAFYDVLGFYQAAIEEGKKVQKEAIEAIVSKIDTRGNGIPIIVFNTHAWERTEPVTVSLRRRPEGYRILDDNGSEIITQTDTESERETKICFIAESVLACGYKVFRAVKGERKRVNKTSFSVLKISKQYMENQFLKVKLDENGQVISVYDKINKRESIPPGSKAGVFELFEDLGGIYDAWDIYDTSQVRRWDICAADSVRIVEDGPVRAVVEIIRRFSKSELRERIVLYRDAHWIDFECWVDWHEEHRLLKVAFPVNISAAEATYDIAFGNQTRPTYPTTSWDKAKFEVVGHKWADMSEANYGVSLINESKYGYDVKENIMRLSLLRSPKHPNPHSDMGEHSFAFRLFPHAGDWREGGTIHNAYAFNNPMVAIAGKRSKGHLPAVYSFLHINNDNVILETIKKAEDSSSIVIRLVEYFGQHSEAKITIPNQEVVMVRETNLLEEKIGDIRFRQPDLSFHITPYEIKTFVVKYGSKGL